MPYILYNHLQSPLAYHRVVKLFRIKHLVKRETFLKLILFWDSCIMLCKVLPFLLLFNGSIASRETVQSLRSESFINLITTVTIHCIAVENAMMKSMDK